jgi:hypothetical protein
MDHTALTTARQILTVLGIDLDQVRPKRRSLRDVLDAYIADLATRATPTHCANVRARLHWLIDDLGVTHVNELQPTRCCSTAPSASKPDARCAPRTS